MLKLNQVYIYRMHVCTHVVRRPVLNSRVSTIVSRYLQAKPNTNRAFVSIIQSLIINQINSGLSLLIVIISSIVR